MLLDDRLVRLTPVVEARVDLDPKGHLAADAEHPAYEPLARPDGHEVLELAHTDGSQETRDQNVRVREVELLDRADPERWRDAVATAAVLVEDRCEDARRVEARAAVPVDRPVGADERDGAQVADDSVLGDRQVRGLRGEREVDGAEGASVYVRQSLAALGGFGGIDSSPGCEGRSEARRHRSISPNPPSSLTVEESGARQ